MFPCKGDELFRLDYPNITDDELEKFKVFAGLQPYWKKRIRL